MFAVLVTRGETILLSSSDLVLVCLSSEGIARDSLIYLGLSLRMSLYVLFFEQVGHHFHWIGSEVFVKNFKVFVPQFLCLALPDTRLCVCVLLMCALHCQAVFIIKAHPWGRYCI